MMFNETEFRSHFPILDTKINGHPLVYFDNGASSLKPKEVADTIYNYYLRETSNIHRGAHTLSRQGTERYEEVRNKIHKFINSRHASEIIFTRGVTEAINLLAYTLPVAKGDTIVLSNFEHHSNVIPWKILCEKTGCRIEVLHFDNDGKPNEERLAQIFSKPVKVVSLNLYSNVTGVRLQVEDVLAKGRGAGAFTILDAAQAMLHEKVDVQKLDCDFLTFSGHKMLAPYGIGALYGRKERLDKLSPFHGGGSMISRVNWETTVYQDAPHKFEAGTPSIADVLGLGTAIDFIQKYSLAEWAEHGKKIVAYLEAELGKIGKVNLVGTVKSGRKCDIISFTYEGAHPSDVGEILDQMGVAVRAGHHCAQPLMDEFGVPGTVRISLAPYNTLAEAEKFMTAMKKVGEVL
jgi:cysteine desulfurase/selenocysteine lyase